MFWLYCCVILVCSGLMDATRVSRIKPSFQTQRGERSGNTRFMGGSSDAPDADVASVPTTESSQNVPMTRLTEGQGARETTASPGPVSVRGKVCEKPYSCVDCSTYRLCVPTSRGLTEHLTGTCPADRPYCDPYSGTCINSVSAALRCARPDSNFRCMHDGHFPHPSEASKYFICSDHKAYGYSCGDGYKYYAPSQGCSRFPWIADDPFHCSELNGTKVQYNSGGSFFAYCVNGQPHVVSSCGEAEFFNATSQVCEPQCSSELTTADSNNCLKFFKCSKNPRTHLYERESLACPSGEGFHAIAKRCVPLQQLPDCKGGHHTNH